MGVRIHYDMPPEFVKPKLDNLDVEIVTPEDLKPSSTIAKQSSLQNTVSAAQSSAQQRSSSGYDWSSWSLNLSLQNIESVVKGVQTFLKELDKVVQVITQILKIMRLLSGNVKSIAFLIKFVIRRLADELKTFIQSFSSTGIYMSLIWPSSDRTSPIFKIPIDGGYREFIQRVNATCTSSSDPDAPKFDNPDDTVGGLILAMLGGMEDPDFLKNLMHNFNILSQFFGFQGPVLNPPKNVKTKAGFYSDKGFKKVLGVKVTWEMPDTPVGAFKLFRTEAPNGVSTRIEVNKKSFVIRVPSLDSVGNPVDIKANRMQPLYHYTDFEVKENVKYYYKVYSVSDDKFFEDHQELRSVDSPIASPYVYAIPRNCIPVSELDKYTLLGVNGELQSPIDLEGQWQSVSIRNLLGKSLDDVLGMIDILSNNLLGLVNTGSDATSTYLKFYSKRISGYLDIINVVTEVVELLMSFNLRGTFMLLKLSPEKGGMDGFLSRFNRACTIGNTDAKTKQAGGPDSPASLSTDAGIARYTDRGIMFGVILLYGFPGSLKDISINQVKELNTKKALQSLGSKALQTVGEQNIKAQQAQMEQTQKAIQIFLKLLGLGG